MPSAIEPNRGAESGSLNSVDWLHILYVFGISVAAFALTWGASFLIPYLQDHGVISVGVATLLTTFIAGLVRLISDGTKAARLVLIGLTLCVLGNSPALADDVVLGQMAPGTVYLKIVVAADGTMTATPLKLVTIGPTPPGPPVPPTPPTPQPLTDRGKAVMTAALAVAGDPDRAGTAHGLAELYRQTAAAFRAAPAATAAQLTTALSTANNTFLTSRNVSTVWQPVRDKIGTYWTVLVNQANPAAMPADFAQLLQEAAVGLDASAPSADGKGFTINPDTLKLILQIIQIILSLLQPSPVPVPTP